MGTQVRKVVTDVAEDYNWMEFGACYKLAWILTDPEEHPFFMEGRGQTYPLARKFCAGCPVVVDCLIDGIEDPSGFRGGTSPTERSEIRAMMYRGWDFVDAVEEVWSEHREGDNDTEVPSASVWEDWE